MAQNQNHFLDDQNDDLREKDFTSQDADRDNDELGENTEQTPIAKAYNEQQTEAENKGWENNKPGITTNPEQDERIPTITPYNENGLPGPDDDDEDLDDDGDYDELIPTEDDEEEEELTDNGDDEDVVNEGDSHIDISEVGGASATRPHGRTSGRMIDHEPGITGKGDNDRYDTTR